MGRKSTYTECTWPNPLLFPCVLYAVLLSLLETVCPSVSTPQTTSRQPLTQCPGWSLEWLAGEEIIRRPDDFWLQSATQSALRTYCPELRTRLLTLHGPADERIVLTVQRMRFSAAHQVSATAGGSTSRLDLRRRLLAPFDFPVLVLGQLLTSANYSSDGLTAYVARAGADAGGKLLSGVGEALLQQSGCSASALLLKDLLPEGHPAQHSLATHGFHPLPVEAVMELPLRPHWHTLDDYLADLTSKYRVRYRRARGKLAGLDRRWLPAPEARQRRDELHALYAQTGASASFNAVDLSPDYFGWLAEAGNVYGYFDGAGTLVGFTSSLPNGPVLHAHYLGFTDAARRDHHLYHNMLFDLLDEAITGGYTLLDYGRTAPEIKSSVGAEARAWGCWLRARSRVVNGLVPRFVPAVFERGEWVARGPFRIQR